MGLHTQVQFHHDAIHKIREDPEKFAELLLFSLGGPLPPEKTKRSIYMGGSHVATLIATIDSSEATLVLAKGSAVQNLGTTSARDGQERLRDDQVIMKDILKPHGLNVVSTKGL